MTSKVETIVGQLQGYTVASECGGGTVMTCHHPRFTRSANINKNNKSFFLLLLLFVMTMICESE